MEYSSTPVGSKNWIIIALLGISGQIAWNVENSWFNTFVFDTITPDPKPIATMVAVSAIVAMLTAFVIGTESDRIGRRRPFILLGYAFWALSTIVFPMSAWAKNVQLAIFLVILLDAVMTFFGSTANDAAFNAWVTDVTDETNRGKVEGILNIFPVIAVILGMGVSGLLIDTIGYFSFFLTLGGLVMIMGLTGGFLLKESPDLRPKMKSLDKGYLDDLLDIFTFNSISKNRELHLVFLIMALSGIATQIVSPYELIYLNNYLHISKTTAGILVALIAPVLVLFALPVGLLVDRRKGFNVLVVLFLTTSLGQFLFSMTDRLFLLGLFGVIKSTGFLTMIVLGTWIRNLMPVDARGKFQGVRLIFMVTIPMVMGPYIGSFVINTYGIATHLNGAAGFIPPPLVYRVSAMASMLPLIPLYFLWRRCHKIGLIL